MVTSRQERKTTWHDRRQRPSSRGWQNRRSSDGNCSQPLYDRPAESINVRGEIRASSVTSRYRLRAQRFRPSKPPSLQPSTLGAILSSVFRARPKHTSLTDSPTTSTDTTTTLQGPFLHISSGRHDMEQPSYNDTTDEMR